MLFGRTVVHWRDPHAQLQTELVGIRLQHRSRFAKGERRRYRHSCRAARRSCEQSAVASTPPNEAPSTSSSFSHHEAAFAQTSLSNSSDSTGYSASHLRRRPDVEIEETGAAWHSQDARHTADSDEEVLGERRQSNSGASTSSPSPSDPLRRFPCYTSNGSKLRRSRPAAYSSLHTDSSNHAAAAASCKEGNEPTLSAASIPQEHASLASGTSTGTTTDDTGHQHHQQAQEDQQQESPPLEPRQISAAILACGDWQALQQVYSQHQERLCPTHVALLLQQLARVTVARDLSRLERVAVARLLTKLVANSQQALAASNPVDLSCSIWSLAKLQHFPGRRWVSTFLDACKQQAQHFQGQELVTVAWGLATLQQRPPAEWLQAWEAAGVALLAVLSPQGLALLSWALAKMQHKPSQAWLAAVQQQSSSSAFIGYSGQNLTNLVWAMATFRQAPPADWAEAFLEAVSARLHEFGPQALANTAWALAVLHIQPSPQLQAQILSASRQLLPEFNAQQLSNLLWSLARLCVRPQQEWWSSFLSASYYKLSDAEPQGLANLAWALGSLSYLPDSRWMSAFLQRCREDLGLLGPQGLANLLWGLASLGHRPSRAWCRSYAGRLEGLLPQVSEQGLANCVWALAKLGGRAEPQLFTALFTALSAKLSRFSSAELSMTAWGLARLPVLPPPLLLEGMEAAVQGQLPSCSGQHTATILAAFARLRHQPSSEWLAEAMQHCSTLAHSGAMNLLDAAQVLWACAMLGRQPGEEVLQQLLLLQEQHMGSAKEQELGQSVWALVALQCSPSPAWLSAFEARCAQLMEPPQPMCLLTLSSVLMGLARLGHRPSDLWLDRAEAAAALLAEVDDVTKQRVQCHAAIQRVLNHYRNGGSLDAPKAGEAEEVVTAGDEVVLPKQLGYGDCYW